MAYTPRDKERLLAFYDDLFENHGPRSPHAVSWMSAATQGVRFTVLAEVGDMRGRSVLDVGCGLGDLFPVLKAKYETIDYTGIDVSESYIVAAREKYREATFEVSDFADYTGSADFVLASGALTFKVEKAQEVYFEMVRKMFERARIALAFNMLNREEHIDDETFTTYTISEVEKFCRTLTADVVVRTDYLRHDFTVYLYH